MKRSLLLVAGLSLAVGGPAAAVAAKPKPKKPSPRAKIYRATLKGATGADWNYSAISGRAQLVDGKKVDTLTITVKGLRPGNTYTWDLHEAVDPAAPCASHAGAAVTAFKYKTLRVNRAGNASSKATAKAKKGTAGFTVGTKAYAVTVHHPQTGEVILCGALNAKKKKPSATKPKPKHKPGHSKPKRG